MSEPIEKKDICLKGVPMDVVAALEQRAVRNYRSVTGEVLAILTAVTRGGDTLPGLGVGEVLPAACKIGGDGAAETIENGEPNGGAA